MGEGRPTPTAAFIIICLVYCFLHFGAITPPGAFHHHRRHHYSSPKKKKKKKNENEEHTSWCVVKPSTSPEKLDEIIDYCCTQPGVDCRVIQAGGMCHFPPNKVSDASVVMIIFYKLSGKHLFDCDFKGRGLIVTHNPSVGKCVYSASLKSEEASEFVSCHAMSNKEFSRDHVSSASAILLKDCNAFKMRVRVHHIY